MNKQAEKLTYLDGLKVISCLMIFGFHFVNFFYPGEYSLLPEMFHARAVEHFIGTTPLNIFVGGKFGVRMFMTLSGFLVGYKLFSAGDKKSLQNGAVKKYFRLVLPILVVNILIYILMKCGAFLNDEASLVAGSSLFVGNYNTFAPSLFAAIKEAVWDCFIYGSNHYNGPIWFIQYEFFGTLLIAAILALVGDSKFRYVVYVVLSVIFIRSDYLPFLLGTVVCDLAYQPPVFFEKISKKKWLMTILLIFGLFLGSFPPIGERLEGTMYQFFPLKIILYYNIGAACVLYSVMHLDGVKKALSIRPFQWFNKYSYGFYLLHFTVLCTFSSFVYLTLQDHMNYHLLALINFVVSFIITTLFSYFLNRLIEKPGIKLANKISKFFA